MLLHMLACLATKGSQTSSKPNILFMVIDDLGSNDLGWSQIMHGFRPPTTITPTIDELAFSGVRLSKYYVDTVCSPTRATFLSGRYPIHNTINDYIHPDVAWGLPLNETTLATLLGRAGYTTHAIGKWHLGYYKWDFTPTFRGFDSFYGYYEGAEDYFAHTRNGAYDLHYEEGHNCGANCSIVPNRSGEYSVNIFTEEAVKRIEASADSASPFFVYLAYQSVHSPHQAPQHYIDMYPDLKENAIMAAMLSALDDGVANVTAALNRTNQTGNTVIILSTDNGGTAGSSNYPLRGEKHSVYEGGVIGTAFITGWGLDRSVLGTQTISLMHAADWLPTLVLGVAKGSVEGTLPLDGVNQWLMLSTNARTTRNETIYGHEDGPENCGLRMGNWKLLRKGGDSPSKWDPPGYGLGNITAAAAAAAENTNTSAASQCSSTQWRNMSCSPGEDVKKPAYIANVSDPGTCCSLCSKRVKRGAAVVAFNWRSDNSRCFCKDGDDTKQVPGPCVNGPIGQGPPSPSPSPPTPPSPPAAPLTLYDLAADPYEHSDQSGNASNGAVIAQMLARLREFDKNLHQAGNDLSCPPRAPTAIPGINGGVWMPWC